MIKFNSRKPKKTNTPVTTTGVTATGKKLYEGDFIPNYPNRKKRREKYVFKDNSKPTKGKSVIKQPVYTIIANGFKKLKSFIFHSRLALTETEPNKGNTTRNKKFKSNKDKK